ncbi:ExbD/TolR family protein [Aureibacter tunicatorum]|uniref:Biopolymer transport protein ExbD n=1 Tax=Aureibacter tunicatorum TaxID=866807 RepID=A0AAE3XP91_9BACT|nr:biopolymer transporter ExbD [Aureibacter tunicatorum]MDR6239603.1 biopolymer transport protein ExbD [Aureibacter tunicatorum]BDD04080.1 biopolymer transporter ExbD [Aureibacter tunicatorum]
MGLESKHKVDASFSMSSMTDIIFLLLIFFMLTSSFITPSGLPVSLPSAKKPKVAIQNVSVTITKDLKFAVNDKASSLKSIESDLAKALKGSGGSVTLHIDEAVPTKYFVKVAGIATSLDAKVSVAAKPEK